MSESLKLIWLREDNPKKKEWTVATSSGSIFRNKLNVHSGWWVVFTGPYSEAKVIRDAYCKVGYTNYEDDKVTLTTDRK